MATQPETMEFILEKLGDPTRFKTRAMFGEYALYADGKTVALICDDQLYVKILPQSAALGECEKGPPYQGAKPHYIVTEDMLDRADEIAGILIDIAASLPAPKKKTKKKK